MMTLHSTLAKPFLLLLSFSVHRTGVEAFFSGRNIDSTLGSHTILFFDTIATSTILNGSTRLKATPDDNSIFGKLKSDMNTVGKSAIDRPRSRKSSKHRFATGLELQSIRNNIHYLRGELKHALELDDINKFIQVKDAIRAQEKKDPEIAYVRAMKKIEKAQTSRRVTTKYDLIAKFRNEAVNARRFIARYNLEGLWIGTFGDHGKELINVTYSGDTLIATKVTGDKHVPRGQVTFRADLRPSVVPTFDNDHNVGNASFYESYSWSVSSSSLQPIQLSGSAATKWGSPKLERYSGFGQVASPGYRNATFIPGQIVIFSSESSSSAPLQPSHFSFLWLPTKHHVVFSRPTYEQITRMTRDILSVEDEHANIREHVERCFRLDMNRRNAKRTKCIHMDSNDRNTHSHENMIDSFRRIPSSSDLKLMMSMDKKGHNLSNWQQHDDLPTLSVVSFWAARQFRSFVENLSSLADKTVETFRFEGDSYLG